MATNTTHYNFKKPDESDFYSIQDQNGNWDKADAALKELDAPAFEDYSDGTTIPDATTAINNIKSRGKLSTVLSNVKAAFKGACLIGQIVNNCVTDRSDLPGSAAQLKVLMDLYTRLNSNFEVEYNPPAESFDIDRNPTRLGWYTIDSQAVGNKPFPYGILLQLKRLSYYIQIAYDIDSGKMARRQGTAAGAWSNWTYYITNTDLGNPYKTALLAWGDYSSGTYTLRESIIGRGVSMAAGSNGRLRGTWASPSINDTMSIVIPSGIIDVKILSATQVQITGTTPDYTIRAISAI